MLDGRGDLAAAELAFYAVALVIAIFVVVRHGFSRQGGWIYLLLLSILRLIGGSCILYAEVNNDPSQGLLTAAAITSSIGTAPLLLALMGFIQRINLGMEHNGLPTMIWRPIQLLAMAGLIIGIVGGSDESSGTPDTTGKSLMEAAAMIFFVVWLVLAVITLIIVSKQRFAVTTEKTLLRACVIALPFLLVRVAYTIAVAFSNAGGIFYFREPNVFVEAFMQFLMEAIVVCLYIGAGLMTPKAPKRDVKQGTRDVEMQGGARYEGLRGQQETGYAPRSQAQQAPRFQAPQNLGDYRPSKLIRNAIGGRR